MDTSWVGNPDFESRQGQDIILFFKGSITVFETHPVSYSICAWAYFSVDKMVEA
jgi:hypothetical protein